MRSAKSHRGRSWSVSGARGPLRQLATYAALLAIVVQTFVIQTHVHPIAGLAAAESTIAGHAKPTPELVSVSTDKAQDACALCQALATSGRALLNQPGTLFSAFSALAERAPVGVEQISVRPSHIWQSRAPPAHL